MARARKRKARVQEFQPIQPVNSRNFVAAPHPMASGNPVWVVRSIAFVMQYTDIGSLSRNQVVRIIELLELAYEGGQLETARQVRAALHIPNEDL